MEAGVRMRMDIGERDLVREDGGGVEAEVGAGAGAGAGVGGVGVGVMTVGIRMSLYELPETRGTTRYTLSITLLKSSRN